MTCKPFRKTFLSLILLSLCVYPLLAQNKRLISGSVVNALNKEPLPFATVALKKLMIGIVTNEEGRFDLYIPEGSDQDTLYISYFGYKHTYIKVNSIQGSVNIALEPSAVELKEVVVRPLAAYYYILMAMRKVKQNYPKDPFETEAYYREKIIENKNLIKSDEGIFKTYYPNYLDTIKTQNQLLLLRSTDNSKDIAFMKEERKKAEEKEKS
jgi:CarboxypepD_reg-like domain